MRFYVIYEYCRGGRFDHDYHMHYDTFEMLDEAYAFIESITDKWGYKNIIGPLFLARSLDKSDK